MNYRKRLILEKPKKPKKGFLNELWKFLNSSFGIFLMSSIVLTGITNYVSNNIQEKQAKIERRKEANSYYVELKFRIFKLKEISDTIIKVNMFNTLLKTAPDTGVFRVVKQGNPFYLSILKQQLDDVINGTGSYRPSDKRFKEQHLVSILSWFSFNMDEPRQMYKETQAVFSLQGTPPFGSPITDDSTSKNNMDVLFEFLVLAQGYVDDYNYRQ